MTPRSTLSPASQLAMLPAPERQAFLNELTPEELAALEYDWTGFWSRPAQRPPTETWKVWLILAGRGYGKSRTGAEQVRAWASIPKQRIALVGETAADVRDVMVEGESGIMRCCPPWLQPKYEPSKRRLTWPNGSIATTYSGDAPEQLRGPNHHHAWCDELCLVAGTQIMTAEGPQPIEGIRAGTLIWTRQGLCRVRHTWQSSPAAQVYELRATGGYRLIGTAQHPVWVEGKGFVSLCSVPYGSTLMVWDKAISHRSSPILSGVGAGGGFGAATIQTGRGAYSIALSTLRRMALSLQGWKFITRTATRSITTQAIWKPLRLLSIVAAITRALRSGIVHSASRRSGSNGPSVKPMWRRVPVVENSSRQRGYARPIALEPVESRSTVQSTVTVYKKHVPIVARPSRRNWRNQLRAIVHGPVPALARTASVPISNAVEPSPAPSVACSFVPMIPAQLPVPAPVATVTSPYVQEIKPLPNRQPVYNLDVEDCPEYFANGILTHNCKWKYAQDCWDNLELGLRLGKDPRFVVTTTPRPIPLIKQLLADPGTVVTRGSTYENTVNMAPSFKERILARYEGTRLGRQELYAEVLEDTPGALWTRQLLEETRVRAVPQLKRILVGLDPGGDAGIVAVGLGDNGHGYVLDDRSMSGSPAAWAGQAIALYHTLQANAIIAERNHGGEMVELTLRTQDKTVAVQTVWASQGKYARAEPVSALYEQGKVHHVGMYAALEDEMVNWVPGEGLPSPNRLDALVWACTALLLGPGPAPMVGVGGTTQVSHWRS